MRYFVDFLVAAHGRASFLISNIGCLGDVRILRISGRAKTGGKYSAPTILIESFVIQAISIFLLKMYVYKKQRLCKNGRKIFRPYNFNRFIRHSGDFNFSVKDVRI